MDLNGKFSNNNGIIVYDDGSCTKNVTKLYHNNKIS